MSVADKIIPVAGMNLDMSPLYLKRDTARLIKNLDISLLNKGESSNVLVLKPLSSNELYDAGLQLPEGENITIGGGVSQESEGYVFNWNDASGFTLYRIKEGKCDIVFRGPELELSLEPEDFLSPTGRVVVEKVCVGGENRTYVYWTNGKTRQGFICVEDSIETNSFTHPFFANVKDRRDLISLGIRTPLDCIKITPVQSESNVGINLIEKRTWRFRISYIDRYGRPSEHGIWSDIYYTEDCLGKVINCLDIEFEAGDPFWEKIQIEVQRGCSTEWEIVEVLDKYGPCDRKWYERSINKKLNYNEQKNTITYRFCGGKDCIPVPDSKSERIENPMPITSNSLFPLNGVIALANNRYGQKPWSCDLKDKIRFVVEKPKPDQDVDNTVRTISVWINIQNSHRDNNQGIWRRNDRNVFGGIYGERTEDRILDYEQYFEDPDQGGFIVYLAGTNIATITEQYKYDNEDGTPQWIKHGVAKDEKELREGRWLQKATFTNIKPGPYVVRIASHRAKLSDAGYQRTSTFTKGQAVADPDLRVRDTINDIREIVVDVCEGDFDSFDANRFLVISDNTMPNDGLTRETRVTDGYVYEGKDGDQGILPIEGATVLNSGVNFNGVRTTDHNGYYFVSCRDDNGYDIAIEVRRRCTWEKIETFGRGTARDIHHKNFYATDKWSDYIEDKCNRVIVKGKVVECSTGNGIPGITVGITRGSFVSTSDTGEFEIIVHDHENPSRTDTIIFSALGKCNVLNCDNGRCFQNRSYVQPACISCGERVVRLSDMRMKLVSLGRAGLQKGGRYQFSLNGTDWMSRQNFAQVDPRWMLSIPTENETQSFQYSRVKCLIEADAVFPSWMKKLHIRFSKNLAYSDFITWVVDRFEFIDNTGLVNNVAPTQIKIYYSSLNEYNKQNAFSTNVNWQFIDEKNSARIQDIVHFVANGDGRIFSKVITSLVKYDKDGRYFLIDYTSDLADLKDGAYLKLMRPSECDESNIYFELCKTIDIGPDGKPKETEFYVDAIDSYQLSRQIPTPVLVTKTVRKIVQNSDPVIYEDVEESESVNIIKPYAWSFEHDSPSDFWGTKCTNRGRPLSKNPYEDILCKKMEVALSGAIGTNGISNFKHYFDSKRTTQFPEIYGGITAGIPQQNIVLFVCEFDHFLAAFDDNSVRYDNSGKAFVVSADNQFGKPNKKSGRNNGCLNVDRNTISYHDGIACWFDSLRSSVIAHNFNTAIDVSGGQCYRYYSFKSRDISKYNRNAERKKFWHGIINPVDSKYYLTDFNLKTKSYINDQPQVTIDDSDTLAFAITEERTPLRLVASFTPEFYLAMQGDDKETQLFSFKDGLPYNHYRTQNSLFNNFFGVQCSHALRVSMSIDNTKVAGYVGTEIYVDEVLMYGKKVITESGQESMIPRNWFNRGYNYWAAPFLCDLKTIDDPNIPETIDRKLTSGDKLDGRWIDVLFVGDPDNLGKYFELTGVTISVVSKEKTGVK